MGKYYKDASGQVICRHAGCNDGHGMDDWHLDQFEMAHWYRKRDNWEDEKDECECLRCRKVRERITNFLLDKSWENAPKTFWKTTDEIETSRRIKESQRRDFEAREARIAWEIEEKRCEASAAERAKRDAPYSGYKRGY